jgi:hypothetical protein
MGSRALPSAGTLLVGTISLLSAFCVCDGREPLEKETLPVSPSEQITLWHPGRFTCDVGHGRPDRFRQDTFRPGLWLRAYTEDPSEPGTREFSCKLSMWVFNTGP